MILAPGLACQAAGRRESAEEYFRLSLELDPLMWVSIQSLCELGADFDVEKHFERFLEKAAGAAARSSAGGPAPAAETRGKRLPWSSYLQASSGGRADENVVCGTAWWRGDGKQGLSSYQPATAVIFCIIKIIIGRSTFRVECISQREISMKIAFRFM